MSGTDRRNRPGSGHGQDDGAEGAGEWHFAADDAGAVSADMVGIMSAVVGLGLATLTVVRPGLQNGSEAVRDTLTGYQVTTSFAGALSGGNGGAIVIGNGNGNAGNGGADGGAGNDSGDGGDGGDSGDGGDDD